MSKALGLLSGGLDSSLAALTLSRQGVEVTCIAFVTPFFGAGRARQAAEKMGFPLIVQKIGSIHLAMVKNPHYGYGKNMNPCIDCHAMMFRLAGEVMAAQGFDFLFSGEVLGQRPMSQNRSALQNVAKFSGHPERILRPLSAQLLEPTVMEHQGLVDRARLLDIQGRSRRRQQDYAKDWGLVDYPSSGGGCLLTEKSFSGRLRDLFSWQPDATVLDVELLKRGRQFRLSARAKLTLGRNLEDNEALQQLVRPEDILLRATDFTGPLGLVSGQPDPTDLATAAAIVASYGKGQNLTQVDIELHSRAGVQHLLVKPLERAAAQPLAL